MTEFRSQLSVWALAILLPVPALVLAPDSGGDMALAYLGFGVALLAVESFRKERLDRAIPNTANQICWRAKMLALALGAVIAAGVFIAFAAAIGAQSNLPMWFLAFGSVMPALGVVPYFTLRTGKPFLAIFACVFLLGVAKLTSCGIVRLVYGPNALADGYMAADWHTAKLMITLFWTFTVSISIVFFALFTRSIFANPLRVLAEPATNFQFVEIHSSLNIMKLTIIIIGVIAMLVGLGFVFPAVALWRNLGTLHGGNAGLLALGSLLTLGGIGAVIAASAKRKA